MTERLLLDHEARTVVASDLHRNLFVEAGAGTGKTTALVARVERLVATGHLADIRHLVAITFTEAAAGELRDRIRAALERSADPAAADVPAEEKERCRVAATRIDDAVITTLHGFAQRILAEHPLAAGLPPAFEVDEGIPAELEFVDRWQSFLDGLLADEELGDVLRVGATLNLSLSRLGEVARRMKDRWDRLARPDRTIAPSLDIEVVSILLPLQRAVDRYAPFAGATDTLVARIEGELLADLAALAAAVDTGDPLEALRTAESLSLPKVGNLGTKALWGDTKAEVIGHINEARQARDDLVGRLRTEVLTRLVPELVRFTLDWADERRRAGRLHFHDLLVLARQLIWRHAAVRSALAERWQVLLIDEFQDTDPLQVELVFSLATTDARTLPASWEELELAPGRVLLVGDPKQSIYRFRGADIGLWQRAEALFAESDRLQLSQNFRSLDPIVRWVNAVFGTLMGEGDGEAQPAYADLHPHRTTLDAGHCVVRLGQEHDTTAAEVRLIEAADIAQAIATLRAAGHSIATRDGDEDGHRPMRFDDVAILVPTRAPIGAIERALDEADIPYRIESRSLVWQTDAVRELLNILAAIENPADGVAVVAALRSPAFACSDADLASWRRQGGRWDHTRPQPEAVADDHPVRLAMDTLRQWHHERHWLPVDELVTRVIRERNLVELTMAQRRPRDHWRRLRFIADQALAFVEAGGSSLAQFLAWAALQTDEGATAVETVVPEPDDDAVRITTIHGAKGLEYPVVVLAGLASGRAPSFADVAWVAGGPEVMVVAAGGGRFTTAGWEDANQDAKRFDEAEATRVLYVAATRARDMLLVSLHVPGRAGADTHARRLLGASAEHTPMWVGPVAVSQPPLFDAAEVRAVRSDEERAAWRERHADALAAAQRSLSVSPTGLAHLAGAPVAGDDQPSEEFDEPAEEFDEPVDDSAPPEPHRPAGDDSDAPEAMLRRGGSAVGRAVHAVLEVAPLEGVAPVDAPVLEALAGRYAAEEGVDAGTVAELAASALASDALVDARASGRVWREVPVIVPIGTRLLEGFIDLLYQRPDGQLVVVDWKTDRARTAAEVDAALDRYRLQGAAYAAAVGTATGQPVAEVRFVFCRPAGEPAVERTIADLGDAVTEVATLLR
jgi:ATP-dependent helicase/nuclease subunit A